MLEFSRNEAFIRNTSDGNCFLDLDKVYHDHLLFVACTTTTVSPSLYDYSVKKGPLKLQMELTNVGKTSFGLKNSIYAEGLDLPLCENFVQPVIINSETRRPSSPPQWWIEKYTQGLDNTASLKIPRHVVPDNGILSTYQVKIGASDLDTFLHTNWANYLKFSYNALVDYEVNNDGKGSITQKAFKKSKAFSLLYLKEADFNDTLDIHLWKDSQNTNLFKFQFFKGSDVVCESQIELYADDGEN